VGSGAGLRQAVQWRRLLRQLRAQLEGLQRTGAADVRRTGYLARRRGLRQSSVRERRMCGQLRAASQTVLGQRGTNLLREWYVGQRGSVRQSSLRVGQLRR
jgi:hypothetical protein